MTIPESGYLMIGPLSFIALFGLRVKLIKRGSNADTSEREYGADNDPGRVVCSGTDSDSGEADTWPEA
jgi:hypothetical protein